MSLTRTAALGMRNVPTSGSVLSPRAPRCEPLLGPISPGDGINTQNPQGPEVQECHEPLMTCHS